MRTQFTQLACTLLLLTLGPTAYATSFNIRGVEGLVNGRLSWGMLYRLEDPDTDLIAIASEGQARTANIDDGNLNYDTGLVSNTVRASGEMALVRGHFGAYVRGSAFYDFENQDGDRDRTGFDSDAEKLVGSDIELRESYLNWSLAPGGMPAVIRLGQQVINWSETNFVRDGLDVVNPVDLVGSFLPTSRREDQRTPLRMLWGAVNITETFSMEAFYQYEWEPVELPPVGWYFSNNDALGGEGLQSWMFGNGAVSDLGTDLDDYFQLPQGTLGFDEDFERLPGYNRDAPSDTGQFGAALIGVLPGRNATKVGFHYIRYHSRLPLIMARTGDAAAVAETAEPLVAARATALETLYLSEGVDPAEAALLGRDAAERLTLSRYANQASYFATYPEDIDLFGLSFSTSTLRTGTLFAGEISHHRDFPFQIALNPLLETVFSPVLFDTDTGGTPLGDYGPGEVIGGFERYHRSQASLEVAQIFRGLLGADQLLISADLSWAGVHDIEGGDSPPLTSSDEDSWGYRLQLSARYSGILGGINLQPFLGFTHDFDGTTPAPVSTFIEDRKTLAVGVKGTYINRITAELRYVSFFHGGRANNLRDRDFLKFQVSYYL